MKSGQHLEALKYLKAYDGTLGGIGIYTIVDKKPGGVYRAFAYVSMPFEYPDVENRTRSIIHAACVYLEELFKKIVHTWPWEHFNPDASPLGKLILRYKKQMPPQLAEDLDWLNNTVYNFAKHHFNFEKDDEIPDHYFSVGEAVAVYLIVRKLGFQIESLSGKTKEELLRD